jgi:hypothetical protein
MCNSGYHRLAERMGIRAKCTQPPFRAIHSAIKPTPITVPGTVNSPSPSPMIPEIIVAREHLRELESGCSRAGSMQVDIESNDNDPREKSALGGLRFLSATATPALFLWKK